MADEEPEVQLKRKFTLSVCFLTACYDFSPVFHCYKDLSTIDPERYDPVKQQQVKVKMEHGQEVNIKAKVVEAEGAPKDEEFVR
eukprot:g2868.t1